MTTSHPLVTVLPETLIRPRQRARPVFTWFDDRWLVLGRGEVCVPGAQVWAYCQTGAAVQVLIHSVHAQCVRDGAHWVACHFFDLTASKDPWPTSTSRDAAT
jgi:hypothetical protein